MNGAELMDWLDEAARFSEPGRGVTRQFLTEEHRQLIDWLTQKAATFGLEHRVDDTGNVIVRRPGEMESAKTLIIGSHQDTVIEGGKYDGMLGVLLPMAVLAGLPPLPFHIELIAFGDEEGTRFNSTLAGSSAIAGCFDRNLLACVDAEDVTMETALRDFGLDPGRITALARKPQDIIGFFEVHIEQGPILENKGLPVGVVTAITGIERHIVTVGGKAGHAGTTPMHLRQDALVRAVRIVDFVDRLCRTTDDLVGVVGKFDVEPNAVNVIPSLVTLTVELRSPGRDMRLRARKHLYAFFDELGDVNYECSYSKDGVTCDADLSACLAEAIRSEKIDVEYLFSGAGHDGLAMANLTRCAMLFVRCKDGLSHHPDEAITADDCTTTMNVVRRFILGLG